MAQKRIRMVQHDGTQGVLDYGEAVSRSKAPINLRSENFIGLTLKQAKMKLGIKN